MAASLTVPAPPARPSDLKVWMRAVRLFSFTASITPVLIGSAFALISHDFHAARMLLILVACVLVHAGCNLANDYFDYRKGTDEVMLLGRGGVIQSGWLSDRQVFAGMMTAFGVATVLGIVILVLSTPWLLVLALPSLAVAFLYTGGPKPLGYVALGELTVWLFMGMGITCGTYVALAGRLMTEVAIGSLGISALVAAILHANNIRDFDSDRASGKTTLAHLLGRGWAIREMDLLVALGFGFAGLVAILWPANSAVLLTLVLAPAARTVLQMVRRTGDLASLNRAVRLTAQLHFRYGLLFAAGLLIRVIVERIT